MNDPVLAKAMKYTVQGWPATNEVPTELRCMFSVRNNLSVVDDLLFYMNRLVIPASMREEIMNRMHRGHMGIVKTQARAQQTVWWPGITKAITSAIEHCQHCQVHRNVQRSEPLNPRELPDRPWQRIDIDMFAHRGQEYMAVSDTYSRWLEIVKMPKTATANVIAALKVLFARWGYPDVIMCDNGTQFTSTEFRKFLKDCDIMLETSSPRYPQSNGGAESAVKQAKKILDQPDQQVALMEYRVTPLTTVGYSPCELLQSRMMKTSLPHAPEKLIPQVPSRDVIEKYRKAKQNQKRYHDKRSGAKILKKLKPGDTVRMRTGDEKVWGPPCKIIKQCGPRSYLVDTGRGVKRRNRRHLQAIPPIIGMIPRAEARQQNAEREAENNARQERIPEVPERRYPTRERRMPKRFGDYIVYS